MKMIFYVNLSRNAALYSEIDSKSFRKPKCWKHETRMGSNKVTAGAVGRGALTKVWVLGICQAITHTPTRIKYIHMSVCLRVKADSLHNYSSHGERPGHSAPCTSCIHWLFACCAKTVSIHSGLRLSLFYVTMSQMLPKFVLLFDSCA